MNARLWLAMYLAALVAATLVHQPLWLALAFGLAFILCGGERWRLLRRALLAILAFNLTVSFGYAAIGLWRGDFNAGYLLLVNLRVLLMVFLGIWFSARVDVVAALSMWPTLALVATLAIGQLRACRQIMADFALAFASRNPAPPRLIDRIRHAAAQGIALMDKSTAAATQSTLAMRSRGVFDD
ncbi:MAG: ABC transporter permease [Burkholderiaceae bacterium]|jgi:cobalt/nickel transport system permease protein|nr:ABC transporter permease [Burkholderiaceae bacterium]